VYPRKDIREKPLDIEESVYTSGTARSEPKIKSFDSGISIDPFLRWDTTKVNIESIAPKANNKLVPNCTETKLPGTKKSGARNATRSSRPNVILSATDDDPCTLYSSIRFFIKLFATNY